MPEMSKEQLYLILGVIFMLIIGCIYGLYGRNAIITKSSPQTSSDAPSLKIRQNKAQIWVHVSGAVLNEGIFSLEQGDRVFDVLKMAKVLPNADLDGINLAEPLTDGEKIFIKDKWLNAAMQENEQAGASKAPKVNINTADNKLLDSLPGIGPTTADRIIEYRTDKGRFANIEQLKEVQGISEKKFGQLSKFITVN